MWGGERKLPSHCQWEIINSLYHYLVGGKNYFPFVCAVCHDIAMGNYQFPLPLSCESKLVFCCCVITTVGNYQFPLPLSYGTGNARLVITRAMLFRGERGACYANVSGPSDRQAPGRAYRSAHHLCSAQRSVEMAHVAPGLVSPSMVVVRSGVMSPRALIFFPKPKGVMYEELPCDSRDRFPGRHDRDRVRPQQPHSGDVGRGPQGLQECHRGGSVPGGQWLPGLEHSVVGSCRHPCAVKARAQIDHSNRVSEEW